MALFKPDQEMVRNIILDHYENPKHKKSLPKTKSSEYFSGSKDSPSCIDNLTAHIMVSNGKIKEIIFDGIGCAIATSSTDIMANQIVDKTPAEAKKIIQNYFNMLDERKFNQKELKELFVFANVNKQINRIKCAKVGIQAIQEALRKYEAKKK